MRIANKAEMWNLRCWIIWICQRSVIGRLITARSSSMCTTARLTYSAY